MSTSAYMLLVCALCAVAVVGLGRGLYGILRAEMDAAVLRERRRVVWHLRTDADRSDALAFSTWLSEPTRERERAVSVILYEIADEIAEGVHRAMDK